MHVSELVELGGLVAVHGSALIRRGAGIPQAALRDYWASSKCRLDRWAHALRTYSDGVDRTDDGARPRLWSAVRPVLEEILASEILTRAFTAAGCGYDKTRGECDVEPIVRSVFIGHLEARNRALNLIVYGRGFSMEEAVALNRLRRRSERWTDMLLGHLHGEFDTAPLAFDPQRAADFADDLRQDQLASQYESSTRLMLAALRSAFSRQLRSASPSADLNRRIAASVLSCFSADLFDATGLFQSLWLERLYGAANDAQVMIDELFALEEGVEPTAVYRRRQTPDGGARTPRF